MTILNFKVKKIFKHKLTCAFFIWLAGTCSNNTLAGPSVDLTVVGVIEPAACIPTVSNGGVADYGVILSSSLNKGSHTMLGEKNLTLTITCDAPVKMAIKLVNGRSGTVAGGGDTQTQGVLRPTISQYHVVGLGKVEGIPIGGYYIASSPSPTESTIADGEKVTFLSSEDNGTSWAQPVRGMYPYNTSRIFSWGNNGGTTPEAYSNISFNMRIGTFITNASDLNLTSKIDLDGLTTIEMIYL